jgi:hypothetical protein
MVVGRGDVHAELVGGHLLLQRAPGELLRRAHAVVDEAHLVQRLQHGLSLIGVEGRGGAGRVDHLAALGEDLGGEVPASVVARAVVAVAVDAVAELGDRLGVLLDLGPGGPAACPG